jgi:methylmalonyl-CoA/ethylmalonyl-CoA epimerase
MPERFPPLMVDHLSIAVRSIESALGFLRRYFPIQMRAEKRPGYDGAFTWTDFFIGDWKLELIESARPGSFVDRFIGRRGEGFHHLSIDVAEGTLADYTAALERDGLRIADRGDFGNGDVTAFISPRTAPGILVQFWQVPGFHGTPPADLPTDPVAELDGVRYRVDHVGIAVRSIDQAYAWFERTFPVELRRAKHRGWDPTHKLMSFWLAGFKMELLDPVDSHGAIARYLDDRGEGFHHLTIHVDPLDRLVARLEADGVRVIGKRDLGARTRTAFIHPHDAHGVLIQLWQPPELETSRRR